MTAQVHKLGFTLLEMIGVLAIIAVLAGALAPSVFQLIDEGFEAAEEQSLRTIGESLRGHIRQTHNIPTHFGSGWVNAVANYASLSTQSVANNNRNFARRYFVDPRFFTTLSSTYFFSGYTQTTGLAAPPVSPRVMVISNLDGNLGDSLNTPERFDDVWEQSAGAVYIESNRLLVERINLASEFVRVVLNNANTAQAGYQLEGGVEGAVAASSGSVDGSRIIYVLAGSRLTLNASPFPGASSLRQLIVSRQTSVRYQLEGSVWFWVNG